MLLEIDSSLIMSYRRGDSIKKGAFLGLTPDLNGAVFSPCAGRVKSVTVDYDSQVMSIEIEIDKNLKDNDPELENAV